MMNVVPMSRKLELSKMRLAVALCLGVALAACDAHADTSVEEFLRRAQAYYETGEFSSGVVEIKNALQQEPKNAAARLLLGRISLELGDGAGAENQLRRAAGLGVPEEGLRALLGRAMLMQGHYEELLEEIENDAAAPSELVPELLILRARAQSSLGDLPAAEDSFGKVLLREPGNVTALVGLGAVALRSNQPEEAQWLLDRAMKLAPEDPDVIALRGDLLYELRQYAEAEEAYRKVADLRPDDPRYLLPLARAQVAAGKTDEAIALLDRFLAVAPRHPGANYLRALAAYRSEDYAATLRHIDLVLAGIPDDLQSLLLAGAASYAQNQNEQAYRYLWRYLSDVPADAWARKLLGATLLRLGRPAEATEVLEPLADLSLDDAETVRLIGEAARRSGDFESAEAYYRRLTTLRPEDAAARTRLAAIKVSLGQTEEAIEDLSKVIEDDPTLDQPRVMLVLTHLRSNDFDSAVEAARGLQESNPDNPIGYTLRGIAHYGKRDIEQARAAFLEALEIKPGVVDASRNLAILELEAGNAERARPLLKEALERNPDHLRVLMQLANLERHQERWEDARSWLEQAVQAHPAEIEPRIRLGMILLRLEDPAGALAVTENYLFEQPENPDLLEVIGRGRLDAGRPADAAVTLRSLVELRPDSITANLLLAAAFRRSDNLRGSRKQLERVLELAPDHLQAKIALTDVMSRENDLQAATEMLAELKQAAPDNPAVIELEGGLAMADGRYAGAVALFRRAADLHPNADLTLRVVYAQERAGDPEGALETLKAWLERNPDDARIRTVLADRHLKGDRFEAAKSNYLLVAEAEPGNLVVRNNLAWVLLRLGDERAALPHAQRALDMAPESPVVMDTLGSVMLEMGQTEQAVAMLQEAADRDSSNAEIRYHLAKALAQQGETSAARDILREVLSSESGFSERGDAQSLFDQLGE